VLAMYGGAGGGEGKGRGDGSFIFHRQGLNSFFKRTNI